MIGYGIGKIIWKYPPFCQVNKKYQATTGKFKVMLHLTLTAIEMGLFVFLYSFDPLLMFLVRNYKKKAISKYFFLFYTRSYITLLHICMDILLLGASLFSQKLTKVVLLEVMSKTCNQNVFGTWRIQNSK